MTTTLGLLKWVLSTVCLLFFGIHIEPPPQPDQMTCSGGYVILHYPNVDFLFQTLDKVPCRAEKEHFELYELRRD